MAAVFVGRQTYDLSHLYPHVCRYQQPASGVNPLRTYTVQIIYSLHCFTRGFRTNEKPDKALLYKDQRETRVFDFQRYELSKRLPAIIQMLSQRRCYHTGKGNFFSVEMVDKAGLIVEYDVFFTASKSSQKGLLNLFVQSAYVRDPEHHANRPRMKPIRLEVVLFNVLHNRPIRTQN